MSRKKPDSTRSADKQAAQDVKAVEARLKELRKRQRELLKNSGKSIKEFRHEIAQLKKAGVVSKRVNAARQEPTKYMRAKVRKFYDVIVGQSVPVRAPKAIREDYASKGLFEARGPFLMVPKESPNMRATLDKKGRIKTSAPIGKKPVSQGGVRINKIVLPYSPADMLKLVNKIENDPNLPEELKGADQYAFNLFGHASLLGFPSKSEMIEYIKVRYTHLFKGESGRQAVRNFVLLTYSGGSSNVPVIATEKLYSQRGQGRKPNATGRSYADSWMQEKRRELRAEKEKKRRAKLTEEQRKEYQEKARQRAAASYAARKTKG